MIIHNSQSSGTKFQHKRHKNTEQHRIQQNQPKNHHLQTYLKQD